MHEPTAILSTNRARRYRLDRDLGTPGPLVLWVMLNPSTADERDDDPTIRRVMHFSRREGFGRVAVCNLHSLRTTDPRGLLRVVTDEPSDEVADAHMLAAAREARTIIVGWGAHGVRWPRRVVHVYNLLASSGGGLSPFPRRLWCLGTTKSGQPRHPLYLHGATRLELVDVLKAGGHRE
jgi:hypothetical protein